MESVKTALGPSNAFAPKARPSMKTMSARTKMSVQLSTVAKTFAPMADVSTGTLVTSVSVILDTFQHKIKNLASMLDKVIVTPKANARIL